jgi:Protein of unknown function (DUF1552)
MKKWSRRDFARHAGIATLFAPFLSVLERGEVQAQTGAGKAKYFLLFFTNGTDVGAWSPRGSNDSSISFSAMTEPLSKLKDSVILVENLNGGGTSAGHGSPGGLCGMGYGPPTYVSVEQFISDGLRANGIYTQIPNLVLGGVSSEQQTTFYRKGTAITPISSPSTAFNAIFGGVTAGAGGEAVEDPRVARRQSILDLMHTQIGQLSQSLGTAERAKLEAHTESIRQLEERLSAQSGAGGQSVPVSASCAAPGAPGTPSETLLGSSMMLSMAVQALGCDLTRVAAVQFGHHQSTQVSLADVGAPGDWHNGFVHSDPAPRQRLVALERWLAGEFVRAAEMLKALPAPDGDGTLYDQTLMLWARDMGDAVLHDDSNMRFVFAGGAGGYLRHSGNGRYIDGGGSAHVRALVTACDAMGITNYSSFGDPAVTGANKTPLALG